MKSETDTAICDRIRLIREANNLSRPQLAEIVFGKHAEWKDQLYIRSVEQGRHGPSYDFLIKVKHHFKLRWEWLIEGKGMMR